MPSIIETHTGGWFDYRDPQPEAIELVDIARALSNLCRFNGLIDGFYSVAEHALLVERLVYEEGQPPEVCLAALHHDSHEAYLGDLPTPLKRTLGEEWKRMEWRTDFAIARKLGVAMDLCHDPVVQAADGCALLMEAAKLKRSGGVGEHWGNDRPVRGPAFAVRCWTPYQAEVRFLQRHHELKAACAVVV